MKTSKFYRDLTSNRGSYTFTKILKAFVIIFGIICVTFALIPIIIYKVFNLGSVALIIISAILFIYSALLSPQNVEYSAWRNNRQGYRALRIFSGFIIVCVIFELGICGWMWYKSSKKPNLKNENTMVIMGAATYDGKPSEVLLNRLITANEFLKENDDLNVIVTGAISKHDTISQGEIMKDYLIKNGIEDSRIYVDTQATNTDTNMCYAKQIIENYNLSNNIIIVTDSFHQARSVIYAEKYGLEPSSLSCDTPFLLYPVYFLREQIGIAKAYLL